MNFFLLTKFTILSIVYFIDKKNTKGEQYYEKDECKSENNSSKEKNES